MPRLDWIWSGIPRLPAGPAIFGDEVGNARYHAFFEEHGVLLRQSRERHIALVRAPIHRKMTDVKTHGSQVRKDQNPKRCDVR